MINLTRNKVYLDFVKYGLYAICFYFLCSTTPALAQVMPYSPPNKSNIKKLNCSRHQAEDHHFEHPTHTRSKRASKKLEKINETPKTSSLRQPAIRPQTQTTCPYTIDQIANLNKNDLLVYLKTNTSYQCLGSPLFSAWSYLPLLYTNEKMQAVFQEIENLSSSYDGTYASGMYGLLMYVHSIIYYEFYRPTEVALDATSRQLHTQSLLALSSNNHLFDTNQEALSILSEYLINLDYTGLRHQNFTFLVVKQAMRNITTHRNWASLGSSDLMTYANAYNSIFFLMFRGTGTSQTGDTNFWAALSQDNEFTSLLATIAKDTDLLANPTLGFMVKNAVLELSRMAHITQVLPLVEPELAAVANLYPRLDIKWLQAINALNQYGDCAKYNLCESQDNIKDELRKYLFPQAYSFDDGKMVMKASISKERIQQLYYATKQVKSQFFRLLQNDAPVANDPNESLNVIIFDSYQLYQDYATYLFNIPANNGGIYIDRSGTFYTWDRSTGLSLESLLRHEYCHYLQSRYLTPGFWGETNMYQNSRLVWFEEGMAEFLAGATATNGIQLLKSNADVVKSTLGSWPSLATVLASSYSSGNFNHYYFGNMLWYNLYKNDFSRIKRLFDLVRNDDITSFDNEVNNLQTTGEGVYITFLNNVYLGNVSSAAPSTQWLSDLRYILSSPNEVLTEFTSITGMNGAVVNLESTLINKRFRLTGQITGDGVANDNATAAQSVMLKLDGVLTTLKNSNINNFKHLVGYTKNVTYVGGVPKAEFVIEGPLGSQYALTETKFSSSQRNVLAGNTVQFEDQSTGYIKQWAWSFSGATPATSNSPTASVTYNQAGTYDVSLTTTNNQGTNSTKTESGYIKVFAQNNASYCSATVGYDYAYIQQVKLGSIDNQTSGYPTNGYGNYTHIFTELAVAQNYEITVVPTYTNSDYIGVSVWIDWNQDGDFDDADEVVMAKKGRYTEAKVSFQVPTHAIKGIATRMRVRLNYQVASPLPCGNDTYFGEVEDYSIVVSDNIQSTGSTPVANFSLGLNYINEGESIYFQNTSTGSVSSTHWEFVGGTPTTSTEQSPVVKYTTKGIYPVILTVSNEYGSDRTLTYINVNKGGGVGGEYCATANTRNDVYIDQVTFGDIANSSDYSANGYGDFTNVATSVEVGQTYPLTVRATKNWSYNQVRVWIDWNQDGDFYDLGEELLYQDNNSTFSANITIPNNAKLGGTRMRVRLGYGLPAGPQSCGTESIGEVEDYIVFVNPTKVIANFSSDKTIVEAGQQVSFTDLSANNPTSWSWTFEGGTPATSNQQNPTVTYNTSGTYQVNLVAQNSYGQDTKVVQAYITVNATNGVLPQADFIASKTIVEVGETVSFTDKSENSPTSWTWEFEGGTPKVSTQKSPTVVYTTPGVYAVSLSVYNANGKSSKTRESYIHVKSSGDAYCYANVTQKGNEYIQKVELGDIDNTSGALGYQKYTNLSTVLEQSRTYDLKVTAAQSTEASLLVAWIDWNQDGSLNDADEKFILTKTTGQVFQASLLVPAQAVVGITRLRVRLMGASATVSPCGISDIGEVEDYSVVVKAAETCQEPQTYPNPSADGKLNLQVPCASKYQQIKIDIIDLKGELKKSFSFTSQGQIKLEVDHLPKGVYFIKTNLDGKISIHRIHIL